MEVTKEQYQRALDVLSKVELAQKAVQAYEEQQRFEKSPETEIIEHGKVEFVEGEIIRDNPLLWRATKLRYVHEKGTVERKISYSSKPTAKNLLSVKSDNSVML